MATKNEIQGELFVLDSSFPATRFMTDDQRGARVASAIDSLSEFTVAEIRTARKALCLVVRPDYPSISEVYAACLEARPIKEPARIPPPKRGPEEHVCVPCGDRSLALGFLACLQEYEAAHILCPVEIKATCPQCGKRFGPVVSPFIEPLIQQFPDDTKSWHANHKGFLRCKECDPTMQYRPASESTP